MLTVSAEAKIRERGKWVFGERNQNFWSLQTPHSSIRPENFRSIPVSSRHPCQLNFCSDVEKKKIRKQDPESLNVIFSGLPPSPSCLFVTRESLCRLETNLKPESKQKKRLPCSFSPRPHTQISAPLFPLLYMWTRIYWSSCWGSVVNEPN